MINPYTERQRKPLTNAQKNKDNIQLHISPNVFPAYNKEQNYLTTRPLTHRPKGKQNKKNKKSIKKDEFPEFAIKFRNETLESSKINDSFTSRTHLQNNMEESFGRAFLKNQIKQEPMKRQITNEQFKSENPRPQKAIQGNKKMSDNKAYLASFRQAIQKIFKSLDVFNRGRISETNINKWIPESALYFLGGVFQKIKQQRLSLGYAEFEALCIPLLKQSAEDDIKWFIEEVSGKEVQLNVSVDLLTTQRRRDSSPVIMKINNNFINHYIEKPKQRIEGSSNRKEFNKSPQPIEFDLVLNNIKNKEKQLNIRLNSMREKQQTNPPNPSNLTNQFSFFNSQKNPQSFIKNQPKEFAQIQIDTSSQKEKKKPEQNDYPLTARQRGADSVPNFSFQLPKQSVYQRKPQNNLFRQAPTDALNPSESSSLPKASRIVRQSIPRQATNSCSKRSSMNLQETDKLDKLSSRLEEYIKFNKEKLEQNKRFIKENSVPRK